MFGTKPITLESLMAELAQVGQRFPPAQPQTNGQNQQQPAQQPTSIYGMLSGQQKPGGVAGLIGGGGGKGGQK